MPTIYSNRSPQSWHCYGCGVSIPSGKQHICEEHEDRKLEYFSSSESQRTAYFSSSESQPTALEEAIQEANFVSPDASDAEIQLYRIHREIVALSSKVDAYTQLMEHFLKRLAEQVIRDDPKAKAIAAALHEAWKQETRS